MSYLRLREKNYHHIFSSSAASDPNTDAAIFETACIGGAFY